MPPLSRIGAPPHPCPGPNRKPRSRAFPMMIWSFCLQKVRRRELPAGPCEYREAMAIRLLSSAAGKNAVELVRSGYERAYQSLELFWIRHAPCPTDSQSSSA